VYSHVIQCPAVVFFKKFAVCDIDNLSHCLCGAQRMLSGHEAIAYNQCLMKLETAYAELEVSYEVMSSDALCYVMYT